MKTISPCTDPTFLINPSPCAPSYASTPAPFTARLSRSDAIASINVPTVLLPTGQLQLTLPTPHPQRGIWQLTVGTPTCCCFSARVFIDTCEPMALAPTHHATGDSQSTATTPIQVCC